MEIASDNTVLIMIKASEIELGEPTNGISAVLSMLQYLLENDVLCIHRQSSTTSGQIEDEDLSPGSRQFEELCWNGWCLGLRYCRLQYPRKLTPGR